MALFADLHDVAQVLSEHISAEVGIADVQPGPPRDVAATTVAAARLTLLYVTPQPGHRNDPIERQPDGARRHPPLTVSCSYVLTTSGADGDDPIAGHSALGRILALYHDHPSLQLPLSNDDGGNGGGGNGGGGNGGGGNGAFSDLGDGTLHVVQVPIQLDQVDKIWTTFDLPLQPWALLEVTPVQLASGRPDLEPGPVVTPGGVRLEVRAGTRPQVQRITPDPVRTGGRVRIDVSAAAALEAVAVDGAVVEAGGGGGLLVGEGGSGAVLDLDIAPLASLGPGVHHLTVRAGGLVSRPAVLRIAEPSAPALDALVSPPHDPADDLVLSGANLAGVEEGVAWPDAGLADPTDVHTLAVTAAGPSSVTVPSAQLAGLATGRAWRLSLRLGEQRFTPHVLVELAS